MWRSKFIFSFYILLIVLLSEPLYSQPLPVTKSEFPHHYSKFSTDSLFNQIDSLKEISDILEIGTEFTSRVAFWGRDYGIRQIGFQPSYRYQTSYGVYYTATQNYWSSDARPLARTYVGMGYQKRINSMFYSSLSYEWCIIHNEMLSEINEPENNLTLDLSYDLNWFYIEPSITYMFGSNKFLMTNLVLRGDYELFNLGRVGRVFFQPEVMMTNSTSPYSLFAYDIGDETTNGDTIALHTDLKNFSIIDYELMIPLTFNCKNFEIKAAYHFSYPISINSEELVRPFSFFTVSLTFTSFLANEKIGRLFKQIRGR